MAIVDPKTNTTPVISQSEMVERVQPTQTKITNTARSVLNQSFNGITKAENLLKGAAVSVVNTLRRLQMPEHKLFLAISNNDSWVIRDYLNAGFDLKNYLSDKPHLLKNIARNPQNSPKGFVKFLYENGADPLMTDRDQSNDFYSPKGRFFLKPVINEKGENVGNYMFEIALGNQNFVMAQEILQNIPKEKYSQDIQDRIEFWLSKQGDNITSEFRNFLISFKGKGQ
ncbi:MAG: hypothetical protein ChlgKO_03650 [Chlamydiales bacterium]